MSILAPPPDRIALVSRLRHLSARLGRRPYLAEFCEDSGLSATQVRRCFGSYYRLLRIGAFPGKRARRWFDDTALLRALRDGLVRSGGVVRARAFQPADGPAAATIARRWQGWTGALVALRDWLERDEPDYPYLAALRHYCAESCHPDDSSGRCGELLRFRALDHAPTGEAGVVFLFGQVAEELGFVLETVRTGFPDALGRRRLGREWHRVRIEFEHRSRNFYAHGHDPRACDLIVCWEHDWLQCPLEVLELKTAIAGLKRGAVLARLP